MNSQLNQCISVICGPASTFAISENRKVYGWTTIPSELVSGSNLGFDEPSEISSLSKIEVIPFETMCYFIEWNISNHKLFSRKTKEQIFTILLLSLFNPTTKQPQHPSCYLYKLPRDIRFEIFKFISTSTWNTFSTKLPHNLIEKRKRN